jgi:hypothetical protein
MVYLALVSAVGGLIGLYWNVFALLPILAILTVASSSSALVHDEPSLSVLTSTAIALFGLQGGFMIGLTSREVVGHFVARAAAAASKRV